MYLTKAPTFEEMTGLYDVIVLDLDLTIWQVEDKYENSIWAKQMIEPLCASSKHEFVTDDVGSVCYLNRSFKAFLVSMSQAGVTLSAVSNGLLFGREWEEQPSVRLMKLLDIEKYFREINLEYKTVPKSSRVREIKHFVGKKLFIDDNEEVLKEVEENTGSLVDVMNRNLFLRWTELC